MVKLLQSQILAPPLSSLAMTSFTDPRETPQRKEGKKKVAKIKKLLQIQFLAIPVIVGVHQVLQIPFRVPSSQFTQLP